VRRGDRVKVAGKMEIERFHRNDLAVSAAGGTALDAEHRPHRGLANRHRGALADMMKALRKTNSRRCLTFTERRRRNRRHDDVFGPRTFLELIDCFEPNFRDVLAVRYQEIFRYPDLLRDLADRLHFGFVRDL
jgi:hypothetical protein